MTQNSVRHQQPFTPVAQMPGTDGVWTFVFIDMIIFLMIFFTFMNERLGHGELYKASQLRLNEWFGVANTLILLTSSWTVVEAIEAARRTVREDVSKWLSGAFVLGIAFSTDKLIEYRLEVSEGINPTVNSFFSFYFFITSVHFLHVIAGILFIGLYWRRTREQRLTPELVAGLENVGLFWHFVDILWVFIFPLLYLVGRST